MKDPRLSFWNGLGFAASQSKNDGSEPGNMTGRTSVVCFRWRLSWVFAANIRSPFRISTCIGWRDVRGALVYLVLLPPAILLYVGACMVLDPYTTVPNQPLVVASLWDSPMDEEHGFAFFTIRSRGIFTTNYNITIDVSVTLPKQTAEFCQGRKMWIRIPGARPSQRDPNTVRILLREVPGSKDARSGGETVVFPYPGYFSYQVVVENESLWLLFFPYDKESILSIDNYSARLQMENANRNIGIAAVSISVAVLGILYKPLSDHTKRPNLSMHVSYSPPQAIVAGAVSVYRISLRNARRYWMVHPVENARVTIVFLAKEGNELREVLHIPAKWDSAPEPFVPGSGVADQRLFSQAEVHDIDPRVDESIALCMKSSGEDAIYAFNAESYFYLMTGFLNPRFRLEKGDYQVRIILKARNAYKEFKLLLKNDGPYFKDVTVEVQE
jgi:hypothetical protein